MKRTTAVTTALLVLGSASACAQTTGVAAPEQTTTTTAAETTTRPDIPPVDSPRTVQPYLAKPCEVVPSAEVTELGLDPADAVEDTRTRSATCRFADRSASRVMRINLVDDELLRATWEPDADPAEFAMIAVDGYPATRSTVGRGCRIVVAVADDQGFWVVFEPGGRAQDDTTCGQAVRIAEAVLAKLPPA